MVVIPWEIVVAAVSAVSSIITSVSKSSLPTCFASIEWQNSIVDSIISQNHLPPILWDFGNAPDFVVENAGSGRITFYTVKLKNLNAPKRQGNVEVLTDQGSVQVGLSLKFDAVKYESFYKANTNQDMNKTASGEIRNLQAIIRASRQYQMDQLHVESIDITNPGNFFLELNSANEDLVKHKSEIQQRLHQEIIDWLRKDAHNFVTS